MSRYSLWKNHLSKKFGERFIDSISVSEVKDYLNMLYYKENRAYRYVESFLKMFYLLFGQAYSRNYLDVDIYNTFCVNKNTKLHMPKMKIDEEKDIIAYSNAEMTELDEYFKGTNAETAYLLGKYCGLRIGECYGLKWSNIDFKHECIQIEHQMQYQNGIIKLTPLKTRNARRTIYMNSKLKEHLHKIKQERDKFASENKQVITQNQTIISDINNKPLSSFELVNSSSNGKIQTVNSMKYHSNKIRQLLGIQFKYHHLRHTFGTRLADQGIPTHLLCNQMGHSSGRVTEKYYIAISKNGTDIIKNTVENI